MSKLFVKFSKFVVESKAVDLGCFVGGPALVAYGVTHWGDRWYGREELVWGIVLIAFGLLRLYWRRS